MSEEISFKMLLRRKGLGRKEEREMRERWEGRAEKLQEYSKSVI